MPPARATMLLLQLEAGTARLHTPYATGPSAPVHITQMADRGVEKGPCLERQIATRRTQRDDRCFTAIPIGQDPLKPPTADVLGHTTFVAYPTTSNDTLGTTVANNPIVGAILGTGKANI